MTDANVTYIHSYLTAFKFDEPFFFYFKLCISSAAGALFYSTGLNLIYIFKLEFEMLCFHLFHEKRLECRKCTVKWSPEGEISVCLELLKALAYQVARIFEMQMRIYLLYTFGEKKIWLSFFYRRRAHICKNGCIILTYNTPSLYYKLVLNPSRTYLNFHENLHNKCIPNSFVIRPQLLHSSSFCCHSFWALA